MLQSLTLLRHSQGETTLLIHRSDDPTPHGTYKDNLNDTNITRITRIAQGLADSGMGKIFLATEQGVIGYTYLAAIE